MRHKPPEGIDDTSDSFHIVGVGASAGGLAAFEAFFAGMPDDTEPGMAFVLVQHLAPEHKSILSELVRRYTSLQVFDIEHGMQVKLNCVYIIPPDRDLALLNGEFKLLEPVLPRGQRMPIDFFFRSLALDQRARAIGVILSGSGSDGAQGVRAIKGEGGIVLAQNPESAEFDGMPQSAIATGQVDYELLPTGMISQLIAYTSHASGISSHSELAVLKPEYALTKVFALLATQVGHDFSHYKSSTCLRRIERRMAVHQLQNIDDYIKLMQRTPKEVEALFRDMLIGVTNFFRNADAFKVLEERVIPKLFAGKSANSAVRIWVPGCSTGEEAYSIAILLAERQEALKQRFNVTVFATDIDSDAIAIARTGLYPASIAADITAERLTRFFSPEHGKSAFRICKSVRDMLVFSEQSVIKDPPFSKLDMISCRNLLIYLDVSLQKKLIPLFHYALKPGGFLFLGTSETVGEFQHLLASMDRKSKLYQRKEELIASRSAGMGRFFPDTRMYDAVIPRPGEKLLLPQKLPLREITEQAMLQELDQVGVLVNALGDILYLHGRSGEYLEPSPGVNDTNNILKMAREGLREDLSTALHRAQRSRETVSVAGLRVRTNGNFISVNLLVRPLVSATYVPPGFPVYLVILDRSSEPVAAENFSIEPDSRDVDTRIIALKQELRAKQEFLQTTNEELETSNEELRSSNEEMQSINEELQSTNEELETSKEELQSVNEELSTVNSELEVKVADLSRANNDMNNLLAGAGIATVFLDHDLRILRYTPTATKIINLIPGDVGRPVSHIVSNLSGYSNLTADTQTVLDTLVPREFDVQTVDGAWYCMRIQPYRTMDNIIEGVVLTFVDITKARTIHDKLQLNEERLRVALSTTAVAVFNQDMALRYTWIRNASSGMTDEQLIGRTDADLFPEQEAAALTAIKQEVLESGRGARQNIRLTVKGQVVVHDLTLEPLRDSSGALCGITGSYMEIDEE